MGVSEAGGHKGEMNGEGEQREGGNTRKGVSRHREPLWQNVTGSRNGKYQNVRTEDECEVRGRQRS